MNRSLKEFLEEKGAKPADPRMVRQYREKMDRVIPDIEKSVRERERIAALFRYGVLPRVQRREPD